MSFIDSLWSGFSTLFAGVGSLQLLVLIVIAGLSLFAVIGSVIQEHEP